MMPGQALRSAAERTPWLILHRYPIPATAPFFQLRPFPPMFKSRAHATDEAAGPSWLERLPREAAMLACLGLSLFLLVTLVSFDRSTRT